MEIVLEVDDVRAAYDAVRASGHPVLEPMQERPWGLTDFRIADPDGYYLRLTSRGQHARDHGTADEPGQQPAELGTS